MQLPDHLQKCILYEIVHRDAFYFINNDKNGDQNEEEDSNNDVSVLSSNEENNEAVGVNMRMVKMVIERTSH